MLIYYGGCEQAGWRSFLADQGVLTMSLSWYGLRRRRQNLRDYRIRDEFPEGARVLLDSGAYSVNKDTEITKEEAYEIYKEYMDFVDSNIVDIEFASEFDALILGEELIRDVRQRYWSGIDPQKWMPVWHSEHGAGELRRLAETHERVGILQSDGTSREISGLLRSLSSGTSFHGVSMTKMDAMRELPLDSVSSTSWLSPAKFGDTFIWDGRELHRYPHDYKHKRQTHRRWLSDNGFDTAKIEADVSSELLRLSVWSWQEFAKSITRPIGVTSTVTDPFGQIQETDPTGVAITPLPMRNGLALREDRQLLPLLSTVTETTHEPDGTEVRRSLMRSPGVNLMQCDTCHINAVCPAFRPGHECAFDIPVEIRTTTQLLALQDTLIELQAKRVLLATMFEQVQGGAIDPNASIEYDRLNRMIKTKIDSGKDSLSIKIEASSGASSGMFSRMFGREAAERVTALPEPLAVEGIIDAEILE